MHFAMLQAGWSLRRARRAGGAALPACPTLGVEWGTASNGPATFTLNRSDWSDGQLSEGQQQQQQLLRDRSVVFGFDGAEPCRHIVCALPQLVQAPSASGRETPAPYVSNSVCV